MKSLGLSKTWIIMVSWHFKSNNTMFQIIFCLNPMQYHRVWHSFQNIFEIINSLIVYLNNIFYLCKKILQYCIVISFFLDLIKYNVLIASFRISLNCLHFTKLLNKPSKTEILDDKKGVYIKEMDVHKCLFFFKMSINNCYDLSVQIL